MSNIALKSKTYLRITNTFDRLIITNEIAKNRNIVLIELVGKFVSREVTELVVCTTI